MTNGKPQIDTPNFNAWRQRMIDDEIARDVRDLRIREDEHSYIYGSVDIVTSGGTVVGYYYHHDDPVRARVEAVGKDPEIERLLSRWHHARMRRLEEERQKRCAQQREDERRDLQAKHAAARAALGLPPSK